MTDQSAAPIFVVGSGRSGSTVFFDVFARHPELAWLSRLARDYPQHLWLNHMAMHARSVPVFEQLIAKHWAPSEAYPFWELNCPGFANPCRDLDNGDVTPLAAGRLRESIRRVLTRRRGRFLAKITGWPRIGYLHQVFPDALFVEVKRDPRAVANSLLDVGFWDGWRGPSNWRRGPLPEDLAEIWAEEQQSFVALAAIEVVMIQRAMQRCREVVPRLKLMTVDYALFCSSTVEVFKEVSGFCGLRWSRRFEHAIAKFSIASTDDKWRSHLSIDQQKILLRTFARAGLRLEDV